MTTSDYNPDTDSSIAQKRRSSGGSHTSQGILDRRRRGPRNASEREAADQRAFRRLLELLTPILTGHCTSAAYLEDFGADDRVRACFEDFGRHRQWRGVTTALRRTILEDLEVWCEDTHSDPVLVGRPGRRTRFFTIRSRSDVERDRGTSPDLSPRPAPTTEGSALEAPEPARACSGRCTICEAPCTISIA
jgi:hypothetical protein